MRYLNLASGHSPPAPLPLRQDENKICSLQKSGSTKAEEKEKHTSYNSVYPVTAFIQKPPPISAYAKASADIRYTQTLGEITPLHYAIIKFLQSQKR